MAKWGSTLKILPILLALLGIFISGICIAESGTETNNTAQAEKPLTKKPEKKKETATDTSEIKSPADQVLKSSKDLSNNSQKHLSKGNIFQLFSGLFVVILSIVIVVWLIKRLGRFSYSGQQTVNVIGGVSLGTREKIVLIEIGNEQLLIGVAPGQVSMLHKLSEPIEVAQNTETFHSVLGQKVKSMLKRDKDL